MIRQDQDQNKVDKIFFDIAIVLKSMFFFIFYFCLKTKKTVLNHKPFFIFVLKNLFYGNNFFNMKKYLVNNFLVM